MTTRRVDRHLIDEERVLVSTRHHPIVAVWPMPVSLVLLIVVAAITARVPAGNPLIDLLWWGWLASVGYVGWRLLEWSSEVFVVTDRRVMLFTGFLTRRIAMMPLVKVTDLTYQRTVWGRLFRYGDFVIESAGQDQALHLVRFLPNPDDLYYDVAGTLFGRGVSRAGEPRVRRAARLLPTRGGAGAGGSAGTGLASWRQWRRDPAAAGESSPAREARPDERTPGRPSSGALPAPDDRGHRSVAGPDASASGSSKAPARPDLEDTATLDRIED